jgi:hypothetical protein
MIIVENSLDQKAWHLPGRRSETSMMADVRRPSVFVDVGWAFIYGILRKFVKLRRPKTEFLTTLGDSR